MSPRLVQVSVLIAELNEILAKSTVDAEGAWKAGLQDNIRTLFDSLPSDIQSQLLLERDPHGNVQVREREREGGRVGGGAFLSPCVVNPSFLPLWRAIRAAISKLLSSLQQPSVWNGYKLLNGSEARRRCKGPHRNGKTLRETFQPHDPGNVQQGAALRSRLRHSSSQPPPPPPLSPALAACLAGGPHRDGEDAHRHGGGGARQEGASRAVQRRLQGVRALLRVILLAGRRAGSAAGGRAGRQAGGGRAVLHAGTEVDAQAVRLQARQEQRIVLS